MATALNATHASLAAEPGGWAEVLCISSFGQVELYRPVQFPANTSDAGYSDGLATTCRTWR